MDRNNVDAEDVYCANETELLTAKAFFPGKKARTKKKRSKRSSRKRTLEEMDSDVSGMAEESDAPNDEDFVIGKSRPKKKQRKNSTASSKAKSKKKSRSKRKSTSSVKAEKGSETRSESS